MVDTDLRRSRGLTAADLARPILVLGIATSTWNAVNVAGLQLADILLVVAAALSVVDALTSGKRIALPWWAGVGMASILLVAVLHVFAPTDIAYQNGRFMLLYNERLAVDDGTFGSLLIALRWCVAVAVLPLVAAYLAKGRGRFVQGIATAFVVSAAISSAVAISDWLGVTQIGQELIGGPSITGRQNGLASHVNNLGSACVLAAPLALHMYGRRRLLSVIALVLIGGGAFVSGSRTAQLCVVIAIIASMVTLHVARQAAVWFAALSAASIAIVVSASPQVMEVIPSLLRFESEGGTASDLGRSMVGAQALTDFATHPVFGVGMPIITHAHSVPLQLLASGGLVLTVGMALYWYGALQWGVKYRHALESIGLAATISVSLWVLQFPFQNQLVDRFLYVPIAIIFAVGVAARAGGQPRSPLRMKFHTPVP